MNSDWAWEMYQHLPLGVALTVSSQLMRRHQKPHPTQKRLLKISSSAIRRGSSHPR